MPLLALQNGAVTTGNKTVFRNTACCLKLTAEEARLLDEFAAAKSVPRNEWLRDAILRGLQSLAEE